MSQLFASGGKSIGFKLSLMGTSLKTMVNQIYFVLLKDKIFDTSLKVDEAFRNPISIVTETTASVLSLWGGEDD